MIDNRVNYLKKRERNLYTHYGAFTLFLIFTYFSWLIHVELMMRNLRHFRGLSRRINADGSYGDFGDW